MAKAGKKQALARDPLTAFNLRVIEARRYSSLSQVELAKAAGCTQQAIAKLERRKALGSVHTVQIAIACNVSPYWLATGDGEMLRPKDLSDDVLAVGVAWTHLKGNIKERFTKDLLELALPFVPTSHPLYKHIERLYRAAKRGQKVAADLNASAVAHK